MMAKKMGAKGSKKVAGSMQGKNCKAKVGY